MKSFAVVSSAGCFLPLLIILNLFLGWLFFSVFHWFLIESALIILFLMHSTIMARKIFSASQRSKGNGIIDVEGRVVDGAGSQDKLMDHPG